MVNFWFLILTVVGLAVFEIITSFDNAVVNAKILGTMPPWARRWFAAWGLLSAVFLVRGIMPWIIIWMSNPALGPFGAFGAIFSDGDLTRKSFELSSPILLSGAGIFLIFLFLNWIFNDEKNYYFNFVKYVYGHHSSFFVSVFLVLLVVVGFAIDINARIALGAIVGAFVFFIIQILKQHADEVKSKKLMRKKNTIANVWAKIFYLEVIDATFSFDSVVGAFAFTLYVPLILIGNGLGAIVVRNLTIRNINNVKKYVYLNNGAMFSVFILGILLIFEAFGAAIPPWVSPIITISIMYFFFWKSKQYLEKKAMLKA